MNLLPRVFARHSIWQAISVALLAATMLAAATSPRALALVGTLTNTTADVAGPTTLTLTISGETVTATLKASAPLVGTGRLEGRFRQGWLELGGKLDEGFTVQFRGALNDADYRGTYVAVVPEGPVQYGKFHLTVQK